MKLFSIFRQNLDDWTTEKLVLAFQEEKKERYFDALFERYHALIYKICLNFTANREESKELTLDVFLLAYERIGNSKITQFEAWLYTLTKNICLDFIRKQYKKQENKKKWWESEKSTQNFMENHAFRRLIYERELEKDSFFQQALLNLPEKQQICIKLFFLQNYSYREVAQQTSFTEKEIKSYLQNGKRNMKIWVRAQLSSI